MAEFLRLYAFSWFYNTPGRVLARRFSFVFPKAVLKLTFMVSPWPADSSWFSVKACSHYHLWEYAQGASCKVGVCVGKEFRALGCPWSIWGNLKAKINQMDRLLDGVCNAVSRIGVPLMLYRTLMFHSLRLFLPPSCSSESSILDEAREKWASVTVSCTARKWGTHTLSLSSMDEITGQQDLSWP